MKKKSAGLIMYRFRNELLEILIGHMGGPFWSRKDEGAWSIPKGEYIEPENAFDAAKREFYEETGIQPEGDFIKLKTIEESGRKIVSAWAFEGDCDPKLIKSNTFKMEWPPKSGKISEFPEIDRADWFPSSIAKKKIIKGQGDLINELILILKYDPGLE